MPYSGNMALPGLHPFRNSAGTAPKISYYPAASTHLAIGEGCLIVRATGTPWGVNLGVAGAYATYNIVGVAAQNFAVADSGLIAVYDDPDQLYTIIVDAATTAAEQLESIGQFAGISTTFTNTYNSTIRQGYTGMVGGVGTTAPAPADTLPLQVMGWINQVGETNTAIYAQAIVRISPSLSMFGGTSGTRPA